jgi:hypothetical protein
MFFFSVLFVACLAATGAKDAIKNIPCFKAASALLIRETQHASLRKILCRGTSDSG